MRDLVNDNFFIKMSLLEICLCTLITIMAHLCVCEGRTEAGSMNSLFLLCDLYLREYKDK